jgi:archaeoflavoprotein AfpA
MVKVAWGITGAGEQLRNTFDLMKEMQLEHLVDIEVFLSKAADKVVKYYKMKEELSNAFEKVFVEQDANTPFLTGRLQMGEFKFFLIAPATSNTVAKLVTGISDSLLTNSAIQGIKGYVPVYIMPVDFREGTTTTILPNRKTMSLKVRKEDAENVEKLGKMEGFHVFEKPSEIKDIFKKELRRERDFH